MHAHAPHAYTRFDASSYHTHIITSFACIPFQHMRMSPTTRCIDTHLWYMCCYACVVMVLLLLMWPHMCVSMYMEHTQCIACQQQHAEEERRECEMDVAEHV